MQQVDIFLIDKSKLFREGMKKLLAETPFRVCGEAPCIEQAVPQVEEGLRPDLVLFDYPADGSRTADLMQSLRSSEAKPKLVVLTAEMNCAWLTTSLSAGADGYLLKDMSSDALIRSLELILLGEKVLPTELAMLLVSGRFSLENEFKVAQPAQDLSEREVEILHCLLQGSSNKLIANQLNITEGTVKVHLKGVLKKINVRNRTQAAIWALNYGIGERHREGTDDPLHGILPQDRTSDLEPGNNPITTSPRGDPHNNTNLDRKVTNVSATPKPLPTVR